MPSNRTLPELEYSKFNQDGSLRVDMVTLMAGEDSTNNLIRVEPKYTAYAISVSATISILKSTAGVLHSVNIGMMSAPTVTIYDNASGASGTVLAHIEPSKSGCYVQDVSFTNGATAWLTAGNAPLVTVSIR